MAISGIGSKFLAHTENAAVISFRHERVNSRLKFAATVLSL
jgi:hypothetical protein